MTLKNKKRPVGSKHFVNLKIVLKEKQNNPRQLVNRTEVPVRFSEIDALGIVWHGHYLKFFEDGREAFGKQYGLGYLDIHRQHFLVPLVNINVDFKKTVNYGENIIIETTYTDCPAAKIIFNYKLFRSSDSALVATGTSIQVFMDLKQELYITQPEFFLEWKKKYLHH